MVLRVAIIPLELLAIFFSHSFLREAAEFLILPAIASAIPLALARSLGLSLGWPPAGSLGGDLRLPQFTVRHLLGWTVAAALLVAAGQHAQQWIGRPFLTILAFAVPLSLGPWGTLWAAMGPRFEYSRWLVTLIACLLANTLTVAALRLSPDIMLPAILVQMVAVLAVLLSLRKAGVRWLT